VRWWLWMGPPDVGCQVCLVAMKTRAAKADVSPPQLESMSTAPKAKLPPTAPRLAVAVPSPSQSNGLDSSFLFSVPLPAIPTTLPSSNAQFLVGRLEHASRCSPIPLPAVHLQTTSRTVRGQYPYEWPLLYSYRRRRMILCPGWLLQLDEPPWRASPMLQTPPIVCLQQAAPNVLEHRPTYHNKRTSLPLNDKRSRRI
jgi:hypothetical protein